MTAQFRFAPAALALLLAGAAAQARATQTAIAADAKHLQPSVWQHHQARFNFTGFTAAYSCDGLEDKVARILRFFGARNPTVHAEGCPRGPQSITSMVWVRAEFDTLGAAGADTPAGQVVQARWTPFRLDARYPFFMGEGDCELIDAIKPVLTGHFSFQHLSYQSVCTPNVVTLQDFRVGGKVLKAVQEHSG